MIIAAFSGTGKTYFCSHVEGAKDFVCMPYKYELQFSSEIQGDYFEGEKAKADPNNEMKPEYPQNYVDAILENMDKYKYLLIPSDWRVLAYLKEKNVPYLLCYPEVGAKEEYQRRYLERGNTDEFMDIFIGGWDKFMESLRNDKYGTHIVLTEKEYLLDAKELIDEIISGKHKGKGSVHPYTVAHATVGLDVESRKYIRDRASTKQQRDEARNTLISNLKDQWGDLKTLHDEIVERNCIDHFTYRFYHGSLKVYSAQEYTSKIVEAFKQLLPGWPLNPYFKQITESGMNISFEMSHNSHWFETTAPILTAFYYAFHMLEAVLQINEKDFEKGLISEEFATFLCLYNLR